MRTLEALGAWLSVIGAVAMAGLGAIAWAAGLPTSLVLALGLGALSAVGLVAASARRRARRTAAVPAAGIPSPDGQFDPDEVVAQDINSGRIWRLGDVHFLSAAEKRRLAMERPYVWSAYRARLFPLPQESLPRADAPSRPEVPPRDRPS